jgi:hypothetical protein
MKYIKKYEGNSKEEFAYIKYWKIPTKDPDLEIALKKIPDCELDRDTFYDLMGRRPRFNFDYVYVIFVNKEIFSGAGVFNREYWDWVETATQFTERFENLTIVDKKYKGKVKITDKDLEKYNQYKSMDKFNI